MLLTMFSFFSIFCYDSDVRPDIYCEKRRTVFAEARDRSYHSGNGSFYNLLSSARAYPVECYKETQVRHHEDAENY
jgi:hypothetical protein